MSLPAIPATDNFPNDPVAADSGPQIMRVLVIDDNEAIHQDFRKTLACRSSKQRQAIDNDEAILFGAAAAPATAQSASNVEFTVDCASQGQAGVELVSKAVLEARPYAMAFVDMRMPPGMDGLETTRKLWEVDSRLHVVICTAYSDHPWDEVLGKLGSTDKLLILKKPFDEIEARQVAAALSRKWLLERRAELRVAELERIVGQRTADLLNLATHDKLTGLPNRSLLTERLQAAIDATALDSAAAVGLLFLDMDRFKVVNDSLGHDRGDALLVSVAQRIRSSIDAVCPNAGDRVVAARLGGDEFVILLSPMLDPREPQRLAERVLDELARPYDLGGTVSHNSASVGITTTTGLVYRESAEMLRDADIAMYRAKAAGRGRYICFDEALHGEVRARLELESELRDAPSRGEIVIAYQPVVSLTNCTLRGFEALVRWQHPRLGLIPPLRFISMAEETGLIVPLGAHILESACRQLNAWRRDHPDRARNLTLAVNLSRRQLLSADLLETVRNALTRHGIPPGMLILEITESTVMEDPAASEAIMKQLRALGVGLHVDDFGTGYSSLSCLHRFPLTGIKVDRSFIEGISERRDYAAIVQAVVQLAHNMGAELVAEGVETAEQVAMLQALQCELAQGYYFARPLSPESAGAYLLREHLLLPALAA
jgi:diguanylate cyclase